MDLKADQEFTLSPKFLDEMGNQTPVPADADITYTADTDEFVELLPGEDGSVVVGALGALGTTNIHATATVDGREVTGDLQVVTVTGDAERMELVAGEPRERTPDAQQ